MVPCIGIELKMTTITVFQAKRLSNGIWCYKIVGRGREVCCWPDLQEWTLKQKHKVSYSELLNQEAAESESHHLDGWF